ncbi:MAG: NMT1/THI5 like protein [Methanoregulaceae archaeon PtaB.Bin009]|jgi:NitT/TauT family transport system substrate-binding protein|nr:MAG: NMT1/THI5 like protein [Methanoregulaceae archaeon PtaB.Bin009]OPY37990.1 MAG: NMT1/THI5 like protein [Methanoregulaceae archaeon PtaU1.Bin066]HNQ28988.1 ABC transporter substrate-binding protein [Methanolinea sp.]HNS82960.1 ABC transporter substrate-binding protein [Methanolinea sp.]
MKYSHVCAIIGVILCAALIAGCITPTQHQGTPTPTVSPSGGDVIVTYTKGTGPMPTLLGTDQIDGYIAWQPFVEVPPMAGIGKILLYSGDLPPQGKWKDHPCCVFTANQKVIAQNPDLTNALTASMILATQYLEEHPEESAEIVADWLAGKGNFTYGEISVSSVDVLKRAFPTVKFVNDPTDKWMDSNIEFVHALRELEVLTGSLKASSDADSKTILFDTAPYNAAQSMIGAGKITTPTPVKGSVGIGYLMSDHHAALFVAIKKWEYFNDTYGIAIKPRDTAASRPDIADFIVNGEKVAEIKLISGDAGPQLMQLMATDNIQYALVGNPPAISAADKGTPVKIIMSINSEGSGVVVTEDSPANDWNSFVAWAKERSAAGKPLRIAAPGKGSIQDVMIRYSLETSGLSIKEG